MKVSILLAAYKSEELLKKVFLPSFWKNCNGDRRKIQSELIIYDNGGNGFQDKPVMSSNIEIVGDGKNIGLNAALNACAEKATGDYFFLPHTDMYLMPGWDYAFSEAVRNQAPASFLMCSRSVEPTLGHTRHHVIKNYGQEADEFREEDLLKEFVSYKNNTIEVGARMPFFMHRQLWWKMTNFHYLNKVGNSCGVDPNYFSYCTDDDLIQTAWHCGVRKFHMVHNSLVYHLQGKSNNQQKVDKDSDAPYRYFVDKWKKIGYPDASHPGQWHPKMIPFYTKVR